MELLASIYSGLPSEPVTYTYLQPEGYAAVGMLLLLAGSYCLFAAGVSKFLRRPKGTMQEELEELEKTRVGRDSTFAECPFCNAGYFYSSVAISSDHRITCQNCNRLFEITTKSDIS